MSRYFWKTPNNPELALQRMLDNLSKRFASTTQDAFHRLLGIRFDTDLFQSLHKELNSYDLIARHSLPYFLMLEDLDCSPADNNDYLVAALLSETCPITHLDPYTDSEASAERTGFMAKSGYSLAALYHAATKASSLLHGAKLVSSCFPVSSLVTERMFLDSQERPYTIPSKTKAVSLYKDYLTATTSRLYGCGYFEVMARAALASQGLTPDRKTAEALRQLGVLRQLTDEIIDLEEDLAAGLLTFPALLLLKDDYARAAPILREAGTSKDFSALRKALYESKVPGMLYRQCVDIYSKGVELWYDRYGEDSSFSVLFDIRMAFLDQEAKRSVQWLTVNT